MQDILELSSLKETSKSERPIIDLNEVFEKAKQNLKEELSEKQALVHCEKLPHYHGNELEFLLIFQNFIQNGIKYNESTQPVIKVSSSESKGALKIYFEDNGIGIQEQYYEQIFQFFKRLHNSNVYQGTGLGLGLCKKIVSNYGGEIEVESQMGAGSKFIITLPTAPPKEKEEVIALQDIQLTSGSNDSRVQGSRRSLT